MASPSLPHCPPASAERLLKDWRHLCRDIGERRAGSRGERRAAESIARGFAEAGLAVRIETFPCQSLVSAKSTVAARAGGRWESCTSQCLVGSSSTPGGKPVDGEMVWLDFPEAAHRLKRNLLRGKIAAIFGALPGDPAMYRRLLAARPSAVLIVDDRLPFTWHKSDAMYPSWVKRLGSLPAVSIPYRTAWRWRTEGISRVRVAATIRHAARPSTNVVATLPGSDPTAPSLLFGAHHDTQPGTIGADDNASGVVFLLEAARLLARCPNRKRTIQFVSFGTEEQLSVGSAQFVQRHRRNLRKIGLVINLDSVSSALGHTGLFHSGHARLAPFFKSALRRGGHDVEINDGVVPYSDHFPFTVYGVPAIWLYRWNARGGQRWQHHSGNDSLANVSADQVRSLIDALLPPVLKLAGSDALPIGRSMPAATRAEIRRLARMLYGLNV